MNYPRKRPQGQNNNNNNNNNQRRRNFSGGGQGHSNHSNNNGGGNRPRKNYTAMREKYLQQARDALSMGDRVLAENYYQHADHCFRMIAEELASRPPRPQPQPRQQGADAETAENAADSANSEHSDTQENSENASENADVDDNINMNVSSLPAFLTASYTPPKVEGKQPTTPAQNWEEE